MSSVRAALRSLGKSGIYFIATLVLYLLFLFLGNGILASLAFMALIPAACILAFRTLRWVSRRSLWSVRDRLLIVYGLIGVLPIFLLFLLIGIGAWALMNELAVYLARSALDRRLDSLNSAVEALRRIPPKDRQVAAPEIAHGFSESWPGLTFYVNDQLGARRFPATAPNIVFPAGWRNVSGLLVFNGGFYAWAHHVDHSEDITALSPLTDDAVENLVPHLGIIALLETHNRAKNDGAPASAGPITLSSTSSEPSAEYNFKINTPSRIARIPPPMGSLDIPVFIPATLPHFHLNSPGKTYEGLLLVYSRPSAVLRSFFSGPEVIRGVLFDAIVIIAVLFLLVELVAMMIGVSLARRITRAVNALYDGTRRVTHGDFRQRIPVRNHDQLGELAESFNQMTGNLERLLAVEKEKERLQTEIEIAREVQAQLYPKEAPPRSGLKLTVECDPARMVSGDYYDYQELGQGKLVFAIGDVAGKGISAALLMATLQAALRAQLAHAQPTQANECSIVELDAARLVSTLNKQIYANTSPEKYATFFFAVFDEPTRTLTYTNAGHLSPLLFRNGDVTPLDSNGTVVGAFPFAKYDESCLTLDKGDLLVCYTDGITEPENAYGEMFGEERLIELIHKHQNREDSEIVQIVLEAVRGWTGSPELHDDMTLLLARQIRAI